MNGFYFFNKDTDLNELLEELYKKYPQYIQEPMRLKRIIANIKSSELTMIIENDYVDKQYRDTYYSYFSQKYSSFNRNCLRLSFFEGFVDQDDIIKESIDNIRKIFIGVIVLRPLNVGNIGTTLLNPRKLQVKGYLQLCSFKVMVYGRKITFDAFPFCSQDDETMTCAETALFNLINYYGHKYPNYRILMPREILDSLERTHYERVLPAKGISDEYITKVLSESHLYPRLYLSVEDFDELLYAYIESGIPLILGLPRHVVICIGHGCINQTLLNSFDNLLTYSSFEEVTYYYLNTSTLIDGFIIMDDNSEPYSKSDINTLTQEYYEQSNLPMQMTLSDETYPIVSYDNNDGTSFDVDNIDDIVQSSDNNGYYSVSAIKYKYDSIIVPLHRRVYIDAARAKEIFRDLFLENKLFVEELQKEYSDDEWITTKDNPLLWRMFLTTSSNFKEFKSKTSSNKVMRNTYINSPYPHFIWVLELGTIGCYREKQARVEVILDATSSIHSANRGILSIRYSRHYVFVPKLLENLNKNNTISKDLGEDIPSVHNTEKTFRKKTLTKIFNALYTSNYNFVENTFDTFSNANLKEV